MNTNTLSSQITGNDYLSAYRSRMEVNHNYILSIAKELTEAGYSVYHPKNGLIGFIHVESEDKQITFGFTEVPYRWYLSCDTNYKLGHGSSRTIYERCDYDNPYNATEIVSNMQPKVPVQVKASQYLNLYTN